FFSGIVVTTSIHLLAYFFEFLNFSYVVYNYVLNLIKFYYILYIVHPCSLPHKTSRL
ncbi:unnamed protein product, partial [Sphagnum jensenii]